MGKFILFLGMACLQGCTVQSSQDSQNYSYHFKIDNTCIGPAEVCAGEASQKCEIDKKFDSKGSYCSALQDGAFNEGCARSSRKAQYIQDCGSQFEDTNIGAIYAMSGRGDCSTDRDLASQTHTRTQLCEMMMRDIQKHPCIANYHWYDSDMIQFNCPKN